MSDRGWGWGADPVGSTCLQGKYEAWITDPAPMYMLGEYGHPPVIPVLRMERENPWSKLNFRPIKSECQ